jgi:1-acyl-sn-glycerol-3-phosphate acyltransferase
MIYWVGWSICWLTVKIFGRMKAYNVENMPRKGGVILAPNHVSFIDPPAVGSGIRFRPVRFMAKIELFKIPVLGFLIRAVGSFPVRQNTADRTAIRKALELLEKGELVCIFPEGTRSPDGKLTEAQPGLGMVALKSRVPIVPAALIGTDRMLPRHSFFLHFAKVRIVYGKPITFDDLYDKGMDREAIAEVGKRVMAAIAELQEKWKVESGKWKVKSAEKRHETDRLDLE